MFKKVIFEKAISWIKGLNVKGSVFGPLSNSLGKDAQTEALFRLPFENRVDCGVEQHTFEREVLQIAAGKR